jgi:hypothetical protein
MRDVRQNGETSMRWMRVLARYVLSMMPAARRSPNFHEPTGVAAGSLPSVV